jgi:pentatricopeptide repeat protein
VLDMLGQNLTSLVRMYAKCGSLDDARLVFERMEDRDVITWMWA